MNKLNTLGGYLNGMNLNPIPLEFSQSMTTTKQLAALLAKIDQVITFTNEWYDSIINDLESEGILYGKLNDQFLTSFGADITAIQGNINSINSNVNNLSGLITALQYTKPSITLSSSPSNYIYTNGDIINSVMLNYNINKGTNDLVKAEIYKNGTLLNTVTNIINGLNSFVDGSNISNDTEYYIKIYDNVSNIQSNIIKFNFYNKVFFGKVGLNNTINDTLILSLNNNRLINTLEFNIDALNNEKIIIASVELLSSILDSDNVDMIESFDKSTMTININNVPTLYNIYVSTNEIIDSDIKILIEK